MKIRELLFVSILLLSIGVIAQAPSPVTDLSANSTTETTTDLSWTTPAGIVTEYKIFQDAIEIATTTNTFYDAIGLTIDTSYDFTVFAFNLTESSTISNTASITTSDVTLPSDVTNLAASNNTEITTDLTWDTASDNIAVTGYEVYQNTNGGGDVLVASPATNSSTISSLVIGNSNDFTVFAKDAAGNSSALASNTVNVTTIDLTAPTNVTNLAASNNTETTTDLTWDTASDNIGVTGYEVYQNTNGGGDVLVTSPATNSTTISSLVIGNSNDFTIFAKDAAGNSSVLPSNTINVVTIDVTDPITISDLAANNITETTVDLTWSTTDNVGVTGYEVFQDITGVGSPVSIGVTGGNTSMNVTGLVLGSSYDFTVYAQDAAGNVSLVSNTVVVLTVDVTPPATIDDLTSSNVTDTTAKLEWSPATDNVLVTDYEVFQDGVSIGLTGEFSSLDITGLVELTIYRFKVTAIDAAGNSSQLSNVEIVETTSESGGIPFTNLNANQPSVDWTTNNLLVYGSIGVGTFPNPSYKLAVGGNIIAEEVRVALQINWPDYVFEDDYNLETLAKVEEFINEYGHLKNIPDALTAESNGISLGEMNSLLLRKIEELTLYTIQQEKKINALSKENEQLQSLNERLQEVEKLIEQLKK